jgi:hypothetical protein
MGKRVLSLIYAIGDWFMGLFGNKNQKCLVCEAHLGRINDLKVEISRLVKERDSERAEYKRAIDVILYKQQTPPIGQGVAESQTQFDPMKALAFFEEEVKKDN